MKGGKKILFKSVFIFAVIILLLRPTIIFSSNNYQAILSAPDVRAWQLQKILKKKPENFRISNIISKENEDLTLKTPFLFFYLYQKKAWLHALLIALSFTLSRSLCFVKRRSALFEISPSNERYLAISVIRV